MAAHGNTASSSKAKAISMHIGLNLVDPKAYEGWSGPLAACEFDANDMAAIAKSQGMAATKLLTKAGTRKAVLAGIRAAAKALKKGDLFLLSYSGHGGQVADASGEAFARAFEGSARVDELDHAGLLPGSFPVRSG